MTIRQLLANVLFQTKLEALCGRTTTQVVLLASLLSKIGFAHPDLDPGDSATFSHNRTFALELLLPLKERLQEELSLQETEYRAFIEAILHEGTITVASTPTRSAAVPISSFTPFVMPSLPAARTPSYAWKDCWNPAPSPMK